MSQEIVDRITHTFNEHDIWEDPKPYKIKTEKTDIKHKSQRQRVTGVIVNGNNTRIDRRLMNKMRAIIYNAKRDGRELDDETIGMLSFIKSVNQTQYNKLVNQGASNASN